MLMACKDCVIMSTISASSQMCSTQGFAGRVDDLLLLAGAQNGVLTSTVKGFRALDVNSVKEYLAEREDLAARIGPSKSESSWQVGLLTHSQLPASLAAVLPWGQRPSWNLPMDVSRHACLFAKPASAVAKSARGERAHRLYCITCDGL